ncbi:LacI family DNA-binding transcriptional regulator [Knoellia sp. Soil729]|uniref:LacI family DNA-binding transcriptional regulator n=1 Tax=Knoellia sp. Soil729 TaxID=1736394 RepID=UPI0006F41B9A|nr:LacI family DNA-binding transcriptional regulator [Knoellia sp. Soil729]KRE41551.1 LacI family transcriptional regulator [Knoellia sp. Soil729]
MAVTIRDVAKAAGVSASTVSRALSIPDMVDPETRRRVTRVAEHLGYRPNRAARGLSTGRTGNLGLILPDLANPFFPSVVKGIQLAAHQADYQVFVADSDEDASTELGLVRVLAKQVDGIILCSPRMKPAELREAATLAPVVLVNRKERSIPSVSVDNVGGMRQIIEHLSAQGHRSVGYVGGPRSSWSNRERVRGLRVAANQNGVELVELGHFAPTFDGGTDAAEGAVISGVSAVVAYNDLVALGLLNGLRDRGVDVPGEMSVVGIDNIPMSAMVQPSLTTLDIPKDLAGRTSVDLLLRLLTEESAHVARARELATELLARHTTAPAPTTSTRPTGRSRTPRL